MDFENADAVETEVVIDVLGPSGRHMHKVYAGITIIHKQGAV